MISQEKRQEFAKLFSEFAGSYPDSEGGRDHMAAYEAGRQVALASYRTVCEAADRGKDVTDEVLLRFFPYYDSKSNREKGAWVHITPAVHGDIRRWFEGNGWTAPDAWPSVAREVLKFVRRCEKGPDDIAEACADFSASPLSKGFQTAMLTPILNALRPDSYVLLNPMSCDVVNYFADTAYGRSIAEYPDANRTAWELMEALAGEMAAGSLAPMLIGDRFAMFCFWLVAVRKYFKANESVEEAESDADADDVPVPGEGDADTETRYWKIAPGKNAHLWEECRNGGMIAIGWVALGDLSGMTKDQFDQRVAQVVAEHDDYTKIGCQQVWTFAGIGIGDRVVANKGKSMVVGIGTVTGAYYYEEGADHPHRLKVRWDDIEPKKVDEYGWQRTVVELTRAKFDEIAGRQPPPPPTDCPFPEKSFALMRELRENPTAAFYSDHKTEFVDLVQKPFQDLMHTVAELLPQPIRDAMETEKGVFAKIVKNDYGQGGAWDFYWGAFYPKGGKRTRDPQLYLSLLPDRLEYGFYIGAYGTDQRKRFVAQCKGNAAALAAVLQEQLIDEALVFGNREDLVDPRTGRLAAQDDDTWWKWLADPDGMGIRVAAERSAGDVQTLSRDELIAEISHYFDTLFPMVLLAISDDPLTAISEYLGPEDEKVTSPEYPLSDCAKATGFAEAELGRWVQSIERKRQAILYGPPGTGKTFMARQIARHLVGGGTGFVELVQFHPSYSYEDFMQGLRPKARPDGGLDYPLVAGRFLEFCERARGCKDTCVLIIDEINRANIARVFGELMYLLEYRNEEAPLASGGTLRIPDNVRILGTMNTADRSIALVDHALRRRFAFIALPPNYGILEQFHASTGFPVQPLIGLLRKLNQEIDDPHYEVGVSFFLLGDLEAQLADIWATEIEPYLEEFFFDRPAKVAEFRWEKVRGDLGL